MSLIYLVVVLGVIGVLLWCLQRFVPMDPTIMRVIVGVVVVCVVVWLLQAFGVLGYIGDLRVPRIR